MTKGTPSFGKHNKTTHKLCRRCGKHSYNLRKQRCAHCGYPDAQIKHFRWTWKSVLGRNRKK